VQHALDEGLKQCAGGGNGSRYLVLLSDGGATAGPSRMARLRPGTRPPGKKLPAAQRPKTYIFGVGDDANLPLLRLLSREDGVLEQVLSTEPMEFKLIPSSLNRQKPGGPVAAGCSVRRRRRRRLSLQDSSFFSSLAAMGGALSEAEAGRGF